MRYLVLREVERTGYAAVSRNREREPPVVPCGRVQTVTAGEETRSARLMRGAQAGDEIAYADLLVLLTTVSARYVRHRVGAVPWVEDVVQEALMTVHRSRHTYDGSRPFAPWFYAILGTRLIDVLRRERRIAGREFGQDDLSAAIDRGTEASWGASDRSNVDVDRIRAAVQALPARQRAVVEALKYGDETVRVAADRLGMTEPALKITAHRGYKALRRLLRGRDRAD